MKTFARWRDLNLMVTNTQRARQHTIQGLIKARVDPGIKPEVISEAERLLSILDKIEYHAQEAISSYFKLEWPEDH